MVLGGNSEVLDVGQAGSDFTVAMRRAAYERDGGRCAFPGCTNPLAELHHIRFRRHGGPATLDNAAWLCGYHHWLVHEGHWTLTRQPDNSYLWTGPQGQQRIRYLKRQ
jgi:5-methylcytosine-specific restriction endonuclease McrA